MNRSSCVLSWWCAKVERMDLVSTSCKQTIEGSGCICPIASAMRRMDVFVLARPRVE
jgi:hypothetical protein